MSDLILVLNAGSSSIKFSLFPADAPPARRAVLCEGQVEAIGPRARFHARDGKGGTIADESLAAATDHHGALGALLAWIERRFTLHRLAAAGHRVVHGGPDYAGPVAIDAAVLAALRRLIPLAPLHQPHNIAAIEAVTKLHPKLRQFACFDTAFHHAKPAVANAFAIPRDLAAEGIKRYGFHGLSYEYIASVLPDHLGPRADGRVVVAHLGSGASMCAMRARKCIATTMSLTPLDGLPMSSRCGDLDPGVVLYLLQQKKLTPEAVADLLYHRSGLLGVSGISEDMRVLLASPDPHAAEAVDLFVYRIGRELGSLAAALGGLDALVFTAGIGEHAPEIRRRVCADAAWLGIEIDGAANEAGGPRISRPASRVSAWAILTDEDLTIARHSWKLLRGGV